MSGDTMRVISAVQAIAPASLALTWSDGSKAEVDLSAWLDHPALHSLRDVDRFRAAELGDWGHSIVWPGDVELGADALWLETLSAKGQGDTRAFLEWRMRNRLSLTKAAEALGLSRRMIAYYSNGEKKVPKAILLACTGWEMGKGLHQAA
ncbi:DUF2442 domain-containing protein [Novosphingobium cyanobacteriorum]|uniref:DUF2442 domain-containing protein n=1 Tax=Novosphingobium cyanobacteriorum TaxID=3024215 RepID=A0ABT6CED1_9SPHN|nr:DUF2442 domain-containing protein [Novosphingobium cyanobacteriorum]MDF8332276.1 DUF2442 domain-containing protein [Novosphingobium cyanobacteriorum]